DDYGFGIAVDGLGNVLSAGSFNGPGDFDPGAGTANLTPAGMRDVFISKLDTNGQYVWAGALGGTGVEDGPSIATDVAGNMYVTGFFEATADFDPGPGTQLRTSPNLRSQYVVRLDPAGQFVWVDV